MANAANRQTKQFSYIYHVNVKNMQTVDLRLNLLEGRLGRYLNRKRLQSFIAGWVDEHVVLGSFIPVENIVKVEKYEILQKNHSSALESERQGFIY